jgi:heme exporter protein B
LAILRKDLRSELRSRYALNALLMFALSALAAVSFSISGNALSPGLHAALFWIVLFFSAMSGLSRSFVKEEESHTVVALKLSASPSAVYLGKLCFNILLLGILDLMLIPLAVILLHLPVADWPLFLLVVGIGSVGLAGASTILAAIVAKASSKGPLFAVLAFPILLPLLVTAIRGTLLSLQGRPITEATSELRLLISYLGVMITASIFLFDAVWGE